MRYLITLLLILWATTTYALDIKLNVSPIELGDSLPSKYQCISYRGRNHMNMAFYLEGCGVKSDGWIYPMINYSNGGSGTNGGPEPTIEFVFSYNGEVLVAVPINHSNQIDLYRRSL